MKGFLLKWLVNILALMAVVNIIPGISADKWQTVACAALALGLVNAFLKPLIILFTLPLNILSLGLFTLLINGFLFYSVPAIVKGFSVKDFWSAFWGALFFSLISSAINLLVNPQGKPQARFYRQTNGARRKNYTDVIDVRGKVEKK